MSEAGDILRQAANLVDGDRAKAYGDMHETHRLTAQFWSAYLNIHVSSEDVAQCMVLLKTARARVGKYKEDNYVDQAGYSGIAGELAKRGGG
jgi:hypothetical protein